MYCQHDCQRQYLRNLGMTELYLDQLLNHLDAFS